MEINGEIFTDDQSVLNKWRDDFESLYKFSSDEFIDEFKAAQINMSSTESLACNEAFNCEISIEEVQKAVDKSKSKKAVGVDLIPNELLKNKTMVTLMHSFFNMCLENKIIPTMWETSIINPIPKTKQKSNDPLKYRGIALQCCMYKLLSVIMND